jgi:hypothetical protein
MLVFHETFRVDIECRDTMESFIDCACIESICTWN